MTGPPPVYNTTTSSSITPDGFDIIISWTVSMLINNSRLSITMYNYVMAYIQAGPAEAVGLLGL